MLIFTFQVEAAGHFQIREGKRKLWMTLEEVFHQQHSNTNKAVTCKTFSLLCCLQSVLSGIFVVTDALMLLSLMHDACCLDPLLSCPLPILLAWMHYSEQKQAQTPRTLLLWKGSRPQISLQTPPTGGVWGMHHTRPRGPAQPGHLSWRNPRLLPSS